MIEDKKYTVYKHTAPNGKVYIGITGQKPEQRWANGNGYKHNTYFYRAIRKYGWENIKHEIICQGPLSAAQAGAVEKSFIHLYDSTNPDKGYNHSTGGEYGALGAHHSDEARRKNSEAHKGKIPQNAWKKGCIPWNKGIHLSPETRLKLSEAHKGKSTWNKGKHFNEESKRKMSISHRGENHWAYGKHLSEETKRKLSEAKKGKTTWAKGKHHSEERKNKMSEKHGRNVLCIETNTVYYSARQAAIELGLNRKCILRVCHGDRETTGGYHWKYVEEQS